ncbi:putative oxidoreductase YusZ [Favolaschia claudopus]|uniref:Oxidoreductase YusZ n=1 Tax=Favolaschia claudopus TaxID=2862362 RepID=A0AAW0CL00_9AGAR
MSPKVWLITGASSGFGRSLVDSVLARGDRVIATSRTLEPIQHLHGTNDNLRLLQLDVTAGIDALRSIIKEAASLWGRIDVLVNNGGSCYLGILEEGGSDLLRKQYEVNVFGLVDVTNACLPYLRAQNEGTIVVIGSRSAWTCETIGLAMYGSSKAAVHAIAETWTVELAQFNIRVLIVEPSAFRTRMVRTVDNYNLSNTITAYDATREVNLQWYADRDGNQAGDPEKAMEAVVDVVRGEGAANGKPWPTYLLLGKEADRDIRAKCKIMTDHLDDWSEVVKSVDFDS